MAGGGSTVRTVPEKDSAEPFFSTEADGTRGTYVLMADGSVRYVKKGISDAAFKAMVTVRGPAPEEFDIDKEAPKVEAPKKDAPPSLKDEPRPTPPPKAEVAKQPEPASGVPAGFQLFSPPGERFSVLLPVGEVKKHTQKKPLPTGDSATMYVFGIDRADSGCGVMYMDLPAGIVQPGTEQQILDQARDEGVKQVPGGKLLKEQHVKLQGYPGRELFIELPGKGEMRARVYLVKNRTYGLMAGGAGEYTRSKEALIFLGSLKLPSEGADTPPPNPGPKPGQQAGQVYAPAGWGCSVEMPKGEIKQLTQNVPVPAGGTAKVQIAILQRGLANVFVLSFTEAPATMGSGEQLLASAREQIAKALPGAKVTDEKKITVDGYKGRDLTIEIPAIGLTRARVVAVGQRLYQASVVGPRDFATSTESDRYLQSLKILAGGGQGAAPNPGGAQQPFPGGGQPFPGGGQPFPPNLGGGQPFPGKGPPFSGGGKPFPPNPGGGRPFPGGGQPGMQPAAGPTISAVDLVRAYQTNRATADKQYTGKTITVRGRVSGQEGNKIVLETGLPSILPGVGPGVMDVVDVYFQNPADINRAVRMGNVTVQGRCEGFNQILDVVISNARLVEGANPGGGNPFPGKGPQRPGGNPFPGGGQPPP
jgi:hypothetical protein